MQLYVLDKTYLQRSGAIIDDFESLVWTDRYSGWGDFRLVIPWNPTNAARLAKGTWLEAGTTSYGLADTGYYEVMIVETVEIKESDDEPAKMTVSGRSFLSMTENRATGTAFTNAGSSYDNGGTTTPQGVIETLVNNAAYYSYLEQSNYYDEWPSFSVAESEPDEPNNIDVTIKSGELYNRCKEVADAYNVGMSLGLWRLSIDLGYPAIFMFCAYKGLDLTTSQTENPPVIFGSNFDTLANTTELRSMSGSKNVAYVYGKDKVVSTWLSATEPRYWDRRVLIVEASDIAGTTTSATNKLKNRGKIELRKLLETTAFDGEIPLDSPYIFNVHYTMGDIVELRSSSGLIQKMRVTEYIRTQDANGERAFPTLTAIE